MKVVLMHGKDTNPGEKWYPWFTEQMKAHDIKCLVPALPRSEDPVMGEWLEELENTHPDEETILIGHSRGGVCVMRYLERLPVDARIKKVILVATNAGSAKAIAISGESNYGFYAEDGYDFEKIKSHCDDFVVFHSRDDRWVPFSAGEENARGLDAVFHIFNDKGHFGKALGEFPELVEEVLQ